MEEIKTILSDCGFSFKKQFGQNFITDKNLLNSIVVLSGADENSAVVEIGCGAGTLTRAIAEKVKKVYGFEIDRTLQPVLERSLAGLENVEITFKDFMKISLPEFERDRESYFVIANLPYYVTTPLIMKLVEEAEKCLSLTVMVQEEVADRLCAKAGTADYGAITAMIALRATCKKVKRVPRTMFMPRPNVDSAVINITFGEGIEVEDKTAYKKIVQTAFSSRRKTLENNIVNTYKIPREQAGKILGECNISRTARGETLTPEQFAELSGHMKGL